MYETLLALAQVLEDAPPSADSLQQLVGGAVPHLLSLFCSPHADVRRRAVAVMNQVLLCCLWCEFHGNSLDLATTPSRFSSSPATERRSWQGECGVVWGA